MSHRKKSWNLHMKWNVYFAALIVLVFFLSGATANFASYADSVDTEAVKSKASVEKAKLDKNLENRLTKG